jgi:hypothetical protein
MNILKTGLTTAVLLSSTAAFAAASTHQATGSYAAPEGHTPAQIAWSATPERHTPVQVADFVEPEGHTPAQIA